MTTALASAALLSVASPAVAQGGPPKPVDPPVKVIVQQWDGADTTPTSTVVSLGGTVTALLPVVGGFAATVPIGRRTLFGHLIRTDENSPKS